MESWKTFSFACMFPVRVFLWLCSFIFGHPLIFGAIFLAAGAWAFNDHRPNLGGLFAALVGLLVIWIAEHTREQNAARVMRNPFIRADWAKEE